MKAYLHGEVCVKGIKVLPDGLKKVKAKNNRYIVTSPTDLQSQ